MVSPLRRLLRVFLSLMISQHSYSMFQAVTNTTDIDTPYQEIGSYLSSHSSRATARRLRRARQRLGSYRHDLLVSMRIVNSVERELIQSEWENWLVDENLRCEHAGSILRELNNDTESVEDVVKWQRTYCASCQSDQESLLALRGILIGNS